MKKFLFTVCAALALTACTKAPKAVITGELANVEDQKVYITENVDGKYVQTDSTDMIGGKFTFSTEKVYPRQTILTFEKAPRMGYFFLMEPGNLSIKGDFNDFQNIALTGTATSELQAAFNAEVAPLNAQLEQINSDYRATFKDTISSKEEIEAKVAEMRAKYTEINDQLIAATNAAIEKNADNLFGALLLSQQPAETFEQVEATIAKVGPNMPANKFVDDLKSLKSRLEAIKVGAVAPDFTSTTPEGTEMSLSSLKGQVVLVDFWASWCGPCRGANPGVVALYNKYKDAGFTVFGVSLDDKKEDWTKAIEDDKLTWYHVSDLQGWGTPVVSTYAISGIPHTVLLDREGKIVASNLHGEELEAKIAELTAAPVASTEAAPATETAAQ